MDVKKAELATAVAAAQQGSSSPPEAAPADDTLADKVSAMERKASSLAEQLHYKVGMILHVTAASLLLTMGYLALCHEQHELRHGLCKPLV